MGYPQDYQIVRPLRPFHVSESVPIPLRWIATLACVSLMRKCHTRNRVLIAISVKPSRETIPSVSGEFLDLCRFAPTSHLRDTQTLTASRRYHRKVSGNKYSQSLPPGYASRHHHRRVSGSRYSHSLPRLYVVSQLQLRRCLLAVSPSNC